MGGTDSNAEHGGTAPGKHWVHLVDGTYELFRSYFALPSMRRNGREVGAARGLLRTLGVMLREPQVTHVACAFDHTVESFRNGLFDGYKTGEGMDPELFSQFELAELVADALGVTVWPMDEFEADDALATGAQLYAEDPNVLGVVIASPDKDLCQCVNDRVSVWRRKDGEHWREAEVVGRFGVLPASIPDYLALVGDTADGIPGLPGWGAKSTSAVLREYGRLESIPKVHDDWSVSVRGGRGLCETLRQSWDDALLYRRLATLRTDVPLKESAVDDLEWRGPDCEKLTHVCETLGMDPKPVFESLGR